MDNLDKVYWRRFGKDVKFRKRMWNALCQDFFQGYVPEKSTVLDVAAGYCEFINSIKAKKSWLSTSIQTLENSLGKTSV